MKCTKTFLKIAGVIMVLVGAALVILSSLDKIEALTQKIALRKARREEQKDYAD